MKRFAVCCLLLLSILVLSASWATAGPILKSQIYPLANPAENVPAPPTTFAVLVDGYPLIDVPATSHEDGTTQLVYDLSTRGLPPGTRTVTVQAKGSAIASDWSDSVSYVIFAPAKYPKPALTVEP
jgi:hypothetical protein